MTDVIEWRLPPRSEYLTLVRAAVGVISGGMSFNYDEIIQLRVAISEAAQMATQWAIPNESEDTGAQLVVRFTVQPDRLVLLLTVSAGLAGAAAGEPDDAGRPLLQILVDAVEFGGCGERDPSLRLANYQPPRAVSSAPRQLGG